MNSTTRPAIVVVIIVLIVAVLAILKGYAPKQFVGEKPVAIVDYSCEAGKSIATVMYQGKEPLVSTATNTPPVPTGSVDITLSDGRRMTLPQTISADGVRYANQGESFVFWSKGNGALVLENNEEKTYIGCIRVAVELEGVSLPAVYSNSAAGFSLRLPAGYVIDEAYHYQALGPGKEIAGLKFTIPTIMATGTNLSSDSYFSVEQIPQTLECSASLFLSPGVELKTIEENGVTYSMATTSEAAAGNRYEETVYALPGTNPCMAIRYFIHYGAIENYPTSTVKEFNKQALVNQFDQIRRTLVVNQ